MTFPEANSAYPYDGTDTKFLDGLEKLRGIEDPKLRELVWEAFEERDRRSRGQQWSATKRPGPRLTPASREFLDDESDSRFP